MIETTCSIIAYETLQKNPFKFGHSCFIFVNNFARKKIHQSY